jgi:predicted CXXCH cytochrome family protein
MRTGHRVALSVPGRRGNLQDTSPWPAFDDVLDTFSASTDLYFYDCDARRSEASKCWVSAGAPSPGVAVSFIVRLRHDLSARRGELGEYTIELINVATPSDPGSGALYPVALTSGGVRGAQAFMVLAPDGSHHLVAPMMFNLRGEEGRADRESWPWRDEHSERWFDFTSRRLLQPDADDAFEVACAGCHLTGYQLEATSDGWWARGVADPNGAYDLDGDGRLEEINIGCESCHGPGSEHLESSVRGSRIVTPSALTPGRESMICGACHSSPEGLGLGGAAPLSADLRMPRPGIRRSDFAIGHTARVDGATGDFYASGDSRSPNQQYSDFIRQDMYRNGVELMTCSSCHDPHGSEERGQLRFDPSDSTACTSCHSGAEFIEVHPHLDAVVAEDHDGVRTRELGCTRCHMVRTAILGARVPELLDSLGGSPVQYYHGDSPGHRFNVPRRGAASVQPSAYTLGCGECHTRTLPNP